MAKSPFIALVTVRGTVKEVEGQVSGGWNVLWGSALEVTGMKVTEALNKCYEAGYEHFDTEEAGEKKIYRLKLRP